MDALEHEPGRSLPDTQFLGELKREDALAGTRYVRISHQKAL